MSEKATDVTNVDGVDTSQDIGDMLEDYMPKDESVEVEEPAENIEEPEVEEPEIPDTPTEEPPEVPTEAPTESPTEPDEVTQLREQLTNLSAVLIQHGINPATLGQGAEQPAGNEAPAQPPSPTAPPTKTKTEIELTPLEISQEEFDGLFESPEKLIGLLNRVRESAVEQVLKSVPTLTANIVNQQTVLNRMVQDFYSENQDLAGVKPFVAVVANEIAARNPDWDVEKVFAEAATESRKRLNLKKEVQAQKAINQPAAKPGLPGTKNSRRTSAPSLSKLEQELQELM